jgi:hypothetical protein
VFKYPSSNSPCYSRYGWSAIRADFYQIHAAKPEYSCQGLGECSLNYYSTERPGNCFAYESSCDCRATSLISKKRTGYYDEFFTTTNAFSASLSDESTQILNSRRAQKEMRYCIELDGERNNPEFYRYTYWVDRFWSTKTVWQHWTTKTSRSVAVSWHITIKDLREYIAWKLDIQDAEKLRLQAVSLANPMKGAIHLNNNKYTLKDAGLDSDCHIVVGWADGIWIRNMFAGLYHGRSFVLRVPGLHAGTARIGNIRMLVAQQFRIRDPRFIRLFLNDRELMDDRCPAEQHGISSNNHQIECRYVLEEFFDAYKRKAAVWQELALDTDLSNKLVLESLTTLEREAERQHSRHYTRLWRDLATSFSQYGSFQPPPLETHSCIVCNEEKFAFEFPNWVTRKCKHPPSICADDLMTWVASELQTKAWNRIRCPECKEMLQNEDMKAHASVESFKRQVLRS